MKQTIINLTKQEFHLIIHLYNVNQYNILLHEANMDKRHQTRRAFNHFFI